MSTLLLRTSIQEKTKRKKLIFSFFVTILSFFSLWSLEFVLPFLSVESIGAWLWLYRFLAVMPGIVPYKKLIQEKNSPHILQIDEAMLSLKKESTKIWTIPWKEIASLRFTESHTKYGIEITTKNGQIFYLPYFSERSFLMLENFYKEHALFEKR